MYTTARSEDLDPDFHSSDFQAPMAGFGYGLPLARLVRCCAVNALLSLSPTNTYLPSMHAILAAIYD